MTLAMLRGATAAAVIIICVSTPLAEANPEDDFSSFWVLGDSLSDNGNLSTFSGGTLPDPALYPTGRFSNGPVWNEGLIDAFLANGRAAGNFAFGGAKAIADDDLVPDLPTQLDAFRASSTGLLGDRPLVSLWFGANDLFEAIPTGAGTDTAADAANAVANAIEDLSDEGVSDFLVFNLPDLSLIPLFTLPLADPTATPEELALAQLSTEAALAASGAFNNRLDERLAALGPQGINVALVDVEALTRDLIDDPAQFGVSETLLPCVIPEMGEAPNIIPAQLCSTEEAEERAFYDPVHPNATLHAEIAEQANAALVPVPGALPLLLTALAFGGLVARGGRRPVG